MISSPDCYNITSLEVELDLQNSSCLQSVMADQYSCIDDVSKRASEEETGNNSVDGGKLLRGTACELIHNNVSIVRRDDVAAKAVSLVGGSSVEDNNENAAPIKINYTGENLSSFYQASRPNREQTDPRSLSRSDLLQRIEGLDEYQREGLFRDLENYVSHMTTKTGKYNLFTARVFRSDSPPTRSRRSIGSGGESSSTLTNVEGNAVQPGYLDVTVLRCGVGEVLVVAGRAPAY
jgi:hypothetical protein